MYKLKGTAHFAHLQNRVEKLLLVKEYLGKRGFDDASLPSITQIRAMVLLAEHGRSTLDFAQPELNLFHAKGLLNTYLDVADLCADMLRFLSAVLPWVKQITDISELLQNAQGNEKLPDFPNGALIAPDVMRLRAYALPATLKMSLSNIEAIRITYMNTNVQQFSLPEHCELHVPIHAALLKKKEDSQLTIVGISGHQTFRRAIPIAVMSSENALKNLIENRWTL